MANEGMAKNKAGELYIQLGLNGLGNMMKGLNQVSGQFLLTKNAAVQMTKPIVDMTHKFGENAISTKKMQLQFKDLSLDMTQRLKYLAKTEHLEGFFNSMEKLQKLYTDFEAGIAPDSKMLIGFHRLGIDINNYSSNFEDLLRLMEDLKKSALSNDYDIVKGTFDNFLSGLDLGEIRWADYLGTDFTKIPGMANALSEEEVKNAIDGEIKLQQLQEKVFNAMSKIFVDHEQGLINIIDKLGKFTDKAPDWINKHFDQIKALVKILAVAKVGEMIGGRAGAVSALGIYGGAKVIESNLKKGIIPSMVSGTTSPFPYNSNLYGDMNTKSGFIDNKTVTINNNISTTDPHTAGNKAAQNMKDALNNNRYAKNTK